MAVEQQQRAAARRRHVRIASVVRGALLDVDGTLLDSNDAHAHSWVEALEGAGHYIPFDHVRRRIGEGGEKLLWQLLGLDAGSEAGEHIAGVRRQIFKSRYLPTLAPFPGARELLERMMRDHLRLVVATSAPGEELDGALEAAGVKDLLGERVSKSDAPRSKPDPDIVRAAVERARLPARELVMLGDTPYDIEAASKAGVPTIALRCGGWSDQALSRAIAIYDDAADLLAEYDTSPLARR